MAESVRVEIELARDRHAQPLRAERSRSAQQLAHLRPPARRRIERGSGGVAVAHRGHRGRGRVGGLGVGLRHRPLPEGLCRRHRQPALRRVGRSLALRLRPLGPVERRLHVSRPQLGDEPRLTRPSRVERVPANAVDAAGVSHHGDGARQLPLREARLGRERDALVGLKHVLGELEQLEPLRLHATAAAQLQLRRAAPHATHLPGGAGDRVAAAEEALNLGQRLRDVAEPPNQPLGWLALGAPVERQGLRLSARAAHRLPLELGAPERAAAQAVAALDLEAQGDDRVPRTHLVRRCGETQPPQREHRQLRVHVHPRPRRRGSRAHRGRVAFVDGDVDHLGRRLHLVVECRPREVVDEHLQVARRRLRRRGGQLASLLPSPPHG